MAPQEEDSDHSEAVREILLRAGWRPGRDVYASLDVPHVAAIFPKARQALAEFGNLRFGTDRIGLETVAFSVDTFPEFVAHVQPALDDDEVTLGLKLFVLAELGGGDAHLVIDERGRIYTWIGELEPYAPSLHRAFELLLLGKVPTTEDLEGVWRE